MDMIRDLTRVHPTTPITTIHRIMNHPHHILQIQILRNVKAILLMLVRLLQIWI
jgi:hypothetical protein